MATKAKQRAKGKPERTRPPLPSSVLGMMTRDDVCEALRISDRMLSILITTGEFPGPDAEVGRSPRWTVQGFNEWVADAPNRPTKRVAPKPPMKAERAGV